MSHAGHVRPKRRSRKPSEADRLEKAFVAQERWTFIGIGMLCAVALISFALDWFKDPLIHSILLKLMAVGGVAVVVAVPLGLGATAVFWRTRAGMPAPTPQKQDHKTSAWAYLLIASGGLGAGLVYILVPGWRGWLWIFYVIVSLLVVGWRLRRGHRWWL